MLLPVCDKHYHKIKENMPLGEELEKLLNYPLQKATHFVLILKKVWFRPTIGPLSLK